jgi:hypothetical protein
MMIDGGGGEVSSNSGEKVAIIYNGRSSEKKYRANNRMTVK